MATTVVCPTDCTSDLPASLFSRCTPITHHGEVDTVIIGEAGTSFASYAEEEATEAAKAAFATEFMALLTAGTISKLTVMGDKPLPTGTDIPMSGGRLIRGERDHVLNFTIDETNSTNHKWVQKIECGVNLPVWYIVSGKLFGGADGIDASLGAGMQSPRDRKALMTFEATANWSARHTEDRTFSPIS